MTRNRSCLLTASLTLAVALAALSMESKAAEAVGTMPEIKVLEKAEVPACVAASNWVKANPTIRPTSLAEFVTFSLPIQRALITSYSV